MFEKFTNQSTTSTSSNQSTTSTSSNQSTTSTGSKKNNTLKENKQNNNNSFSNQEIVSIVIVVLFLLIPFGVLKFGLQVKGGSNPSNPTNTSS
jgi:cobalamin biosynthesis Mg chelatase CobN